MIQISIFSDNKKQTAFWSSVLSEHYQVDTVPDITSDFTADITIVDADKIIQDKGLLSLFSKKSTRFLVIGSNWSEENQIEALLHGASGYCNKKDPTEILPQAIERILKGDIWVQRHIVSKVIESLAQTNTNRVFDPKTELERIESSKLLLTLSKRERDVAEMIRSGSSNKKIASSLFISERTVKAHLTSIFRKLNLPDRLHLALFIKEFDG